MPRTARKSPAQAAKKKARKARTPAMAPILVEYDHYEIMERGFVPTIADITQGTGSLEPWDMYLDGFRTAEAWINQHYHIGAEKLA